MPTQAQTTPTPAQARVLLASEIELCGFYPDLVIDSVEDAIGDQPLLGHLVHHEATFLGGEIHRHLTVLALTPTRLLVGHTDENPLDGGVQAITSVESVALSRLASVVLTRVVQQPENFATGGSSVYETWLTLGWGGVQRVDLEPAGCEDPECLADHGYTGTSAADDLTIRMSQAADGAKNTARLVAFARLLQASVGSHA